MIEIRDGIYFSRIWFVGDGASRDFMLTLFREDAQWTLRGRIRSYIRGMENDPNAPDEKCWFSAHPPDEAAGIAAGEDTINGLAAQGFGDRAETVVVGSDRAEMVMQIFAAQSWAHVREEKRTEG